MMKDLFLYGNVTKQSESYGLAVKTKFCVKINVIEFKSLYDNSYFKLMSNKEKYIFVILNESFFAVYACVLHKNRIFIFLTRDVINVPGKKGIFTFTYKYAIRKKSIPPTKKAIVWLCNEITIKQDFKIWPT